MAKQVTIEDLAESINDIAISLSDMATMVSDDFKAVRREMVEGDSRILGEISSAINTGEGKLAAKIDIGFAEVYANQRETNVRLERLEAKSDTLENDVRDLYEMISEMQKDIKNLTKDERRRLNDLEDFAMQVAEKTGIPFKRGPKPKRRS